MDMLGGWTRPAGDTAEERREELAARWDEYQARREAVPLGGTPDPAALVERLTNFVTMALSVLLWTQAGATYADGMVDDLNEIADAARRTRTGEP